MNRRFNVYGEFEDATLILCQPTGKELQPISHALDIKIVRRFNCFYDLEFRVPKKMIIDGEEYLVPYYEFLRKHRQVKVDGYGMFTIDEEPTITYDDNHEEKYVKCKSIDSIIANTDVISFKGTYKLYDQFSNDETIMSMFLKAFNSEWKIIECDAELQTLYRTYDISEMNWYEFLIQKVEEDYQCIFEFDTLNKTIKINTVKNAIPKTDIYISDENLLKKIEITEVTDGIKTCLAVYGADGIDIRSVNPTGTQYIYNLDYYCDESLMFLSSDSIAAYKRWKSNFDTYSITYGNLITSYKEKNNELLGLEIELTELNHQLDDLKNVLSVRIQQGLDTSSVSSQISSKEEEIRNKGTQIGNKNSEIDAIEKSKLVINSTLDFKKAFTTEQWNEVYAILRNTTGTYINESFAKTDLMSEVDIQQKCQDLLDLGKEVLNRMAIPKYTFTSEMVNFFMLEEFSTYADQLRLGCEVTLHYGDKLYYPILLEMPIEFNDKSKSSMVFCNDLRQSDKSFVLADIMNGVNNTVTSNNTMSGTWGDYINSGDKYNINNFLNSALDLVNNKILSTTGQAPLIDHTGIWGRKKLDNGTFDKRQTVMTSNGIYMTDSNWTGKAKLALGEITFGGTSYYGIASDLLVGNIVATSSLIIKNSSNSFILDANGFSATNASISLKRSDGSSEVYLNPYEGIKIRSKINGVLQDVFYVDGAGNLNFKGSLTGATGTFSGTINGASFVGGNINIGNGNFTVDNAGNCKAYSMSINGGGINGANITGSSITGNSISGGTITGTNINGTNISGANITGGTINVNTDVSIGSNLIMQGSSCSITFNGASNSGIYCNGGNLRLLGSVSADFLNVDGNLDADTISSYSISASNISINNQPVANENYVDNLVSNLEDSIPVNGMYNSSSKLLKFYNWKGQTIFSIDMG